MAGPEFEIEAGSCDAGGLSTAGEIELVRMTTSAQTEKKGIMTTSDGGPERMRILVGVRFRGWSGKGGWWPQYVLSSHDVPTDRGLLRPKHVDADRRLRGPSGFLPSRGTPP